MPETTNDRLNQGRPDLNLLAHATPRGMLFLFALAALLLRLPGLFTDFWLDEVWTFEFTRRLQTPLGILTDIRHSNNHHLNTFIYYLVYSVLGDQGHWIPYRIHSLLAGVGSVILACRIGLRVGRLEALFAGLFTTTSYLLIHFSSEGRGYSLALFFALASYLSLQSFAERKSWGSAVTFWLFACMGILSHLLYLHAFAALSLWLWIHLADRGEQKPAIALQLAQSLAPPSALFAWLYFVDIDRARLGAGPDFDPFDVLVKAASYAGGGPAAGPFAIGTALLTAAVSLASIIWLWRRRRSDSAFFLVAIFLAPALMLGVMRADVIFVRYYLLSVALALIATSFLAANMWRRGRASRLTLCVFLALHLIGNGLNVARFYQYGRGQYLEALQFMIQNTQDHRPVVTSNHHFRNGTLIRYYNRLLPPDEQVVYVEHYKLPEWFLFHVLTPLEEAPPKVITRRGTRYRLARVFRYSDLSGWHWILYRKNPL